MASTIYTPQNPSPRNEVRDMSLAQDFTCVIDGVKCTDYQILIYQVSDSAQVYDSTKITLGTPLADGETLTHTVPASSISNTGTDSYKWTIEVFNDTESATSREFQFSAKTTPVLTFTYDDPITSQSYEFTATLTQAEGDIVNNYTFDLYDSLGEVIDTSGLITSFNIKHTFEGLVSGQSYQIRLDGTTTGGDTFDSGLQSFDVSYSEPSLTIIPDATVDQETSLINVEWGEVVQIIGTSSGDISYIDDFIYEGNTGLNLETSESSVSFDVDIPLDFTVSVKWKPNNNDFEGKIVQFDDGAYEVGYETGRFYYDINGTKIYDAPTSISGSIFYIVCLPQKAQIIKTQLFTQLEDLSGTILGDFSGTTLEDIGTV